MFISQRRLDLLKENFPGVRVEANSGEKMEFIMDDGIDRVTLANLVVRIMDVPIVGWREICARKSDNKIILSGTLVW